MDGMAFSGARPEGCNRILAGTDQTIIRLVGYTGEAMDKCLIP